MWLRKPLAGQAFHGHLPCSFIFDKCYIKLFVMVILHENKVHYMIYQKYFLVKWCSHKWNIITSLTEK